MFKIKSLNEKMKKDKEEKVFISKKDSFFNDLKIDELLEKKIKNFNNKYFNK